MFTYVFEVESYDQFNNLAETKQEVVGIKVTYKGGDEVKKQLQEQALHQDIGNIMFLEHKLEKKRNNRIKIIKF